MSHTQKVGAVGEELSVRFLVKKGYDVIDRNYRRPWGELDIVAKKKGKIHFIEVKTLSYKIVSSETSKIKDFFRPEDHVNDEKVKRLGRIIQTYLGAKHVSSETKWQFDVVAIVIDVEVMKAKIKFLEDVTM